MSLWNDLRQWWKRLWAGPEVHSWQEPGEAMGSTRANAVSPLVPREGQASEHDEIPETPQQRQPGKTVPAPNGPKPPVRVSPFRTPAVRKPFIIGLDFGTHSTKTVIRQRGELKGQVVVLDEQTTGYPRFASPSLVRRAGDRLFFGQRALIEPGGMLYRSLKVQLLPPAGHDGQAGFPAGPSPDILVASYLSWILQRIRAEMARFDDPPVLLNLAAPMDHIESESLKLRYLHVVQAAWESTFGPEALSVHQGMSERDLFEKLQPWLDREVPDPAGLRFKILPETVAPIVSLSQDPRMAQGMYLILDMGAGTTEVSVNFVGGAGADLRVRCYADESQVLGGDNFSALDRLGDGMVATERSMKLVTLIGKLVKRVWAIGYRKDAPNHSARKPWKRLTVLLTGGGARRPEVTAQIVGSRPTYPWPTSETVYDVRWHVPRELEFAPQLEGCVQEDLPLLAVAHGLSVEAPKWPDYFVPGQIAPLEATAVADRPPAYWYVEGK